MSVRKKISKLEEVSPISGSENLLVAVESGNKRTTLQSVKEYVGESYTQAFTESVTGTVTIIEGASSSTESGTLDVVYLSTMGRFAARRNINGAISYFSEWNGRSNYQSDELEVRTDRVFYCLSDRSLYVWDGSGLVEQINASQAEINSKVKEWKETTEEELESMIANETWEDGVIYYTVES